MMQRNESLQAVVTALRIIEYQLKQQDISNYAIEWRHLVSLIEAAQRSVAEGEGIDKKALVKAMATINNKIDAEVLGLELELHGVQHFASLTTHQIAALTLKQELKNELNKQIHLIATSPMLAKHADFSDIIALLQSEPITE